MKEFLNKESTFRWYRRIMAIVFLASLPLIAHFAEEQKTRQPICPTAYYSVNCEVQHTATPIPSRTPVLP